MGEDLTVLIIGSGAREHAISQAYEKSPSVKKIIVSPGEDDFIGYNRDKEVIIDKNSSLKDPQSILAVADRYKSDRIRIDVAQDDALALGTVNLLREHGYNVFGPTQEASRIESSKIWSRQFMARHDIPSPGWKAFDNPERAKAMLQYRYTIDPESVFYVKADGLAAGKGAIRAENITEAYDAIDKMASFGGTGKKFLIEGGMEGEEFSTHAISDGKSWHILKSAQDNKRIYEGDKGQNTGGMGAISPAMVTRGYDREIERELIAKAINGMGKEDRPFTGILYLGGMKTPYGLKVVEYNARWGDPEAQVVMPGILNDYMDVVDACITGTLDKIKIQEDNKTRVCVVASSIGYPGDYSNIKGKQIFGLENLLGIQGINVLGAGITIRDGNFYANGGRLFNIIAEGKDVVEARKRANEAMRFIYEQNKDIIHYRRDIGLRDEMRFKQTSQI
ncbi:MAG TPA: phosphoribosylamine--glycine ligase [Candidatus Nanoarchaeia archaeon]|nr:phosphoribosylamine--glycine ligase [Candidatus Nanoarchaeia archaeon]